MSDNLPPEPASPTEAGNPSTVTNISGGVNLDAQHDVNIAGDIVGRDKVTSSIDTGGAYVAGNVTVSEGSEFVGRDKTIFQTITNIFQGDTAQRDARNRRNMLELVKNTWVEGVLEKSLYHEMMFDLGLEERPDAVQHPWDTTLQMPDHENRALSPGTKIMQVFDDMNHALLLFGEPGSGKTTMLLELARDTIARAQQDPLQPIPVVLNLSSWSVRPKQSIADWLVKELNDKYDVSKKIARPWIDNDDLLLLLDGLDEVKAEYREPCIKAINDFRNEHGRAQLVVCSRIADYEALATQLRLRGAVLIQPLTPEQIDQYLARAGDELAAVREALQHDTDLQELAQSPLMLSVMSLAYADQSVDSLTSVLGDPTQRRKHLFAAYMDKMFARTTRAKYEPYSKEDTVRWLTWLAARMSEHGQTQTVFLLEGMQPSWLQSQGQRWTFSIVISVLILGLIGGLVGALIGGLLFGVLLGLVGGRASMRDSGWMKIKLAESIRWSWSGPVWGSSLGVGLGLVLVLVLRGGSDLVGALGVGLLMGVFVALFVGLETAQIETKTRPNQGVWLSGRNAVFLMLLFWLFSELIIGLLDNDLVAGLRVGLLGGLLFATMFGGIAFIKHLVLRFVIWLKGDIPLNYVRFLDYAADRIFLRKVGGGYIFIHRMLMEYFAVLED